MSIHSLLTSQNCTVVFIDHQPQMLFGVANIDRQTLINNTVGLARAAKTFRVPTILTTVETHSFSGYMCPQLLEVFPDHQPIERTSMNSWEELNICGRGGAHWAQEAGDGSTVDRGLSSVPNHAGDRDSNIPPGTAFEALPDDWSCPVCGAKKSQFALVQQAA